MFESVMAGIRDAGTIILHRHNNPDGDALGSQIGLWSLLKNTFPEKKVYKVGDGAGRYAFMKESTMDEVPDNVWEDIHYGMRQVVVTHE